MVTLAGNVVGPIDVVADTVVSGNLAGDALVRAGRVFRLTGNMRGDVVLERDAQAEVLGNHAGTIVHVAAL